MSWFDFFALFFDAFKKRNHSDEELVLEALSVGELSGLQIAKVVADLSSRQWFSPFFDLYPLLYRLENKGIILRRESFFKLTDAGVRRLERFRSARRVPLFLQSPAD